MKLPTILCVDDTEVFLEFYERFLSRHGYMVIAAADGHQALLAFQANGAQIDAVIVDYEMPGMTGVELARLLKIQDPALPILMISGCHPECYVPSPFIDLAVAKGSPIGDITSALALLVAGRGSRRLDDEYRQTDA